MLIELAEGKPRRVSGRQFRAGLKKIGTAPPLWPPTLASSYRACLCVRVRARERARVRLCVIIWRLSTGLDLTDEQHHIAMSTFDYGHKGQLDYLDLMTMLSPSYSKEQAELRKLVESVMCTPHKMGVRAYT